MSSAVVFFRKVFSLLFTALFAPTGAVSSPPPRSKRGRWSRPMNTRTRIRRAPRFVRGSRRTGPVFTEQAASNTSTITPLSKSTPPPARSCRSAICACLRMWSAGGIPISATARTATAGSTPRAKRSSSGPPPGQKTSRTKNFPDKKGTLPRAGFLFFFGAPGFRRRRVRTDRSRRIPSE